jgi:hypothetical protein
MGKEIRIVEEGVGVWVVYKGQEWIIKFYDAKGKKQAQFFVQDYFGIGKVA